MSYQFYIEESNLIMEYFPDYGDASYLINKLRDSDIRTYYKNFLNIKYENLIIPAEYQDGDSLDSIEIKIGNVNRENGYVYLDKEVFNISFDFAFDGQFVLYKKYFVKDGFSLIKALSDIAQHDIFVDSNRNYVERTNHISLDSFKTLINRLPTSYELNLYRHKSIENIVENFLDIKTDFNQKYEQYVKRRRGSKGYKEDYSKQFSAYKADEYRALYNELRILLNNDSLSEQDWQNKIVSILRIIYPKYVLIISKFEFTSLGKNKEVDFLAIDSDGDVDVIEIKKASIGPILKTYRGNYVSRSELSGALIQTEQYIYLLQSEKVRIEEKIQREYASELGNLKVNIINPQGIVLLGRSNLMNKNEKNDFEVIKRMHKNISEIITYDNLVERLKNLIEIFTIKSN